MMEPVTKIGTVHNEGIRVIVEELKKVKDIEGDPYPMLDVSPFTKLIGSPYIRANLEMPKDIMQEMPKIPQ